MSAEQDLIDALRNLTDKIDLMSGQLGRGTKSKSSQVPGGSSKTARTPEEKAAAAKMDNLAKMAAEGVDIQKIMAKSDDLFGVDGEIRLKLLEHVTMNSGKADKVHQTCNDICLALKLWDGAFSDIHMQKSQR